jgi:hypothetical protein
MLTAFYVRYLIEAFKTASFTRTDLNIFRAHVLLMSIISMALPISVFILLKGEKRPSILMLILITILFWGVAILVLSSLRQKNVFRLWSGMAAMVLSVCLAIMPLVQNIAITNPKYRSYQELRHRKDLKDVNFYFNGEIPGKFIEVIWNTGHEIKFWDTWKNPQLPGKLPILFLSHEDPTTIIPADILSNKQIEVIGHFDSNPRKTGGNVVLSNFITIIR